MDGVTILGLIVLFLFSGSGITGMATYNGGPAIINAQADPVKVRPGESLAITIEARDSLGIASATAEFPFEGGSDILTMLLIARHGDTYTYQAVWVVHDTMDQKWYNTTVTVTNPLGQQATTQVPWQDPTQGHPASQMRPGTFGAGNYEFPDNLTVGGTDFFVDDSTGNVGIGTDDPSVELEVAGTNSRIRINETDGRTYQLRASADKFTIDDITGGGVTPFVIEGGTNSNLLYINASSGNVGIGTNSPTSKLYVNGIITYNAVNDIALRDSLDWFTISEVGGYASLSWFSFYDSGDSRWEASHATVKPTSITSDSAGELLFNTADETGDGTALTWDEAMRIDNDGKVGIGTASPGAKLQIGDNTADSSNYIIFGEREESAESNLPFIGQFALVGSGNDLGIGASSSSGEIHFFTGNANPFTDANIRMSILSDGKVGINTTSPSDILEIQGGEFVLSQSLDGTDRLRMTGEPKGSLLDGLTYPIIYTSNNDLYDWGSLILQGRSDNAAYGGIYLVPNTASNGAAMVIDNDGEVGIGGINPSYAFDVNVTGSQMRLYTEDNDAAISFYDSGDYAWIMGQDYSDSQTFKISGSGTDFDTRYRFGITTAGNAGIMDGSFSVGDDDTAPHAGTDGVLYVDTAGGTVDSTGTLYVLAEEVYTLERLEPGDVVIASSANVSTAEPSSKQYDTKVIGVISTRPNIIFTTSGHSSFGGDNFIITDEKAPMVIAGRVPVKITNENGNIEPGDLLTTSSVEGHAMKFTLLNPEDASDFDELKSILKENEQRRNSVIGKALESFDEERGEIVALINLQ